MKTLLNVIIASVLIGMASHVSAQCPTLYDLKVDGSNSASVCVPGDVELSVRGIQMPSEGTISWHYSENENFDPRTEGTLIGTTNLPKHTQLSCPVECPDLLMIMMNSCGGDGSEPDNEFFIFSSGTGFYADNIQFSFNSPSNTGSSSNPPNQNNHINIGNNPCMIKKPSNAFMNQLRAGSCSNLNLFAAGPGDYIPGDALVIFYTSSEVTFDYNINTICGSGHNVYVMQSGCRRTMGAFTNVLSNSGSSNTTRNNMLSLKNCSACKDSLNYSLVGVKNAEGEYIIDNDFPLASVANGSILVNNQGDPCQTPDLSNYLKPSEPYTIKFSVADGTDLCGKKIYFKAYVTPSDETICQEVVADGASLNVKCSTTGLNIDAPESVCSGNPLEIDLGAAGDYTWTVSVPAGVTGLSGGNGNNISSIVQTPVYNGTQQVVATYTISSGSADCPSAPVVVSIRIGPALSAMITGNTQLCYGEQTTLTVSPANVDILWSTGAQTPSINVSASGKYSVKLSNGVCEADADVDIVVSNELKPTISGNTNICQGESTTLAVNENFDTYTWSDGQTGKAITVSQAGTYSVTVQTGNCTAVASVEVKGDGALTILEKINPVSCAGNDGSAELTIGGNVSYTILWSSGETISSIANKPSGEYTYTIYYGSCEQNGSVFIPLGPDVIIADILVEPVSCDGLENGTISLFNIHNGMAPYVIKLDGVPTGDVMTGLEVGDYLVSVEDASGCKLEQNVNMFQAPDVEVILPQELSMTQGESVVLHSDVTGTDIRPDETVYQWSPSNGLSCTDCQLPVASPSETTEYTLTVTNAFGCEDSDVVIVEVTPALKVFVPKAFSPNGDGKNDVLYILSLNEDVKVKVFEVFNRWGVSVFKVTNAPVNNPVFGWNGYYKGQLAPIDNYLYYYEVEFSDLSIQREEGTVLIIR